MVFEKIEFIDDINKIQDYLSDESLLIKGKAEKVFIPKNEEEVIEILKYCYDENVRVTISGAGTGITGSRVPIGGYVISTENLTEVEERDDENLFKISTIYNSKKYSIYLGRESNEYFAICPPGIPLKVLNSILTNQGLFYAPDPTEDNAFLGGTVATNASGPRTLLYGTTRENVRRIKLILPNGERLEVKRNGQKFNGYDIFITTNKRKIWLEIPKIKYPNLKKNAAGYFIKENMELIDLIIGSEGTLGFISEIEIKLHKKPKNIYPIYLLFKEEIEAYNFVKILKRNKENLGLIAIEFFDSNSTSLVKSKYNNLIEEKFNSIVFIEVKEESSKELEILEAILNKYLQIKSFVFTEQEINKAKEIRHEIPSTINYYIRKKGLKKVATDIAVPEKEIDNMYNFYIRKGKESNIDYFLFGHIGDNHLHFNFVPKNETELKKAWKIVYEFLEKAVELNGTVTAEHGLGKKSIPYNNKEKYLIEFLYSEEDIRKLLKVKKTFDEKLILNVGNIIPLKYYD